MNYRLSIAWVALWSVMSAMVGNIILQKVSPILGLCVFISLMMALFLCIMSIDDVDENYILRLSDDIVLDITTIVPAGTEFIAKAHSCNGCKFFTTSYSLSGGVTVKIEVNDKDDFFIDIPNKMIRLPLTAFTVKE